MHIGILVTGHVPDDLADEHGDYGAMFRRLMAEEGFSFTTWKVVDGEFPDSPEDADGWLITGSRHGAYEDHPWIPPLEQFIRDAFEADRPIVGVCFGHQIIAQAMGGRVEKFGGGWSVGPQVYHFPDGPRTVQAWHQDQVTQAPEGAETVASNDFCAHAALLYPRKAYSVQPHPEFDDRFVSGLIEARGPGVVPDTQLAQARDTLGKPLDSKALAHQFATFFRERRIA